MSQTPVSNSVPVNPLYTFTVTIQTRVIYTFLDGKKHGNPICKYDDERTSYEDFFRTRHMVILKDYPKAQIVAAKIGPIPSQGLPDFTSWCDVENLKMHIGSSGAWGGICYHLCTIDNLVHDDYGNSSNGNGSGNNNHNNDNDNNGDNGDNSKKFGKHLGFKKTKIQPDRLVKNARIQKCYHCRFPGHQADSCPYAKDSSNFYLI